MAKEIQLSEDAEDILRFIHRAGGFSTDAGLAEFGWDEDRLAAAVEELIGAGFIERARAS